LAYAPHEAFNLLQESTIESFLRWDSKTAGINVKAGAPLEVKVRLRDGRVGERTYPFLRSSEYTVTLEDGRKIVATLSIDDAGKIDKAVRVVPAR
jgi:hypothetical protein